MFDWKSYPSKGKIKIVFLSIWFMLFEKMVVGQRLDSLPQIIKRDSTLFKQNRDSIIKETVTYLKNKTKIKIKGVIRNETYWANNSFAGQGQSNFYNRTYIDYQIVVGSLPFRSSLNTTSEDFQYNKQISGFNLNFDFEEYRKIVEQKIKEKALLSTNTHKIDSMSHMVKDYIDQSNKLRQKFQNVQFKENISKVEQIVTKALTDSIYAQKRRLKINHSIELLKKYKKEQELLDSLNGVINRLNTKIMYFNALKELENIGLKESDFMKLDTIKKVKGIISDLNIVNSIRHFNVGYIYPAYSEAVLHDVSLRGFNIEVKPGRFYAGYCLGLIGQNSILNNTQDITNKGRIQAMKLGIGSPDNIYFGIVVLEGNKNPTDTFTLSPQIIKNKVIGVQTKILIGDFGVFEFEKAWSDAYQQENRVAFSDLSNSILKNVYNSSTNTRLGGFIRQSNTKYLFYFRKDDPFYYSIGNPFNRKDCYRYDSRIDQGLIKNKLNIFIGYKLDKDNVSGIKGTTTSIKQYEIGQASKLKKTTIRFSYKLIQVKDLSHLATLSNVKILNLSVSRNSTIGKQKLISNINYTYTDISQYLVNSRLKTDILTLTSTLIANKKINFNSTFNGVFHRTSPDSTNSYNVSIGINYLYNSYVQLSGSYKYQEIIQIEKRNILSLGIGLNTKKMKVNMYLENQFVDSRDENMSFNNLSRMNMSLTYLF